MGWKIFSTDILVTLSVAVGATPERVEVSISDSVEVIFEIDVGKGFTDDSPEVSRNVWTDPVVSARVSDAVTVCTAEVVRVVKELSGTVAAALPVVFEVGVAIEPTEDNALEEGSAELEVERLLVSESLDDEEKLSGAEEEALGKMLLELFPVTVNIIVGVDKKIVLASVSDESEEADEADPWDVCELKHGRPFANSEFLFDPMDGISTWPSRSSWMIIVDWPSLRVLVYVVVAHEVVALPEMVRAAFWYTGPRGIANTKSTCVRTISGSRSGAHERERKFAMTKWNFATSQYVWQMDRRVGRGFKRSI